MRSKQLPTLKSSRSQPNLQRNSLPPDKTPSSPRHDPFLSLSRNESGKLLPVCPSGLRIPHASQKPSITHPKDIFQHHSSSILPPLNPRRGSQLFSPRNIELTVSRTTKTERLSTPCFGSSGSETVESVSTMLTIDDLPFLPENNAILENPENIYQLAEKIGDGPWGSVYKAFHRSTHLMVEIKILKFNDADISQIQKDIAVLKKFRSSNIVEFLESHVKNNELWIVMEYCKACSVTDLILINKKCLNETQIAVICQAVLRAIDYLHHNKCAHGNLKGRNILIEEGGFVKLSDGGLASIFLKHRLKPEEFKRNSYCPLNEPLPQSIFNRSDDIWSLGITAIEMAEGSVQSINKPLEPSITSKKIPTSILTDPFKWSEEFNDFISKCLIIDPNQRPTAKDLLVHPFIRDAKGLKVLKELFINPNDKCIIQNLCENQKEGKEEDCNEPKKQENEETVLLKLMKHTKQVNSNKSPCFLKRQQLHGPFLNGQLKRRNKN